MKLKNFLIPATLVMFFSYYVLGDPLHRLLHHLEGAQHSHQVRCLAAAVTIFADDEDHVSKDPEISVSKCSFSKSLQNISRTFKQKEFFSLQKIVAPITESIPPGTDKSFVKQLLTLTPPSTGPPVTSQTF